MRLPEILYDKVTLVGLECINEFDIESYVALASKQSDLLEDFVGLEEELEASCWEYLEKEGKDDRIQDLR